MSIKDDTTNHLKADFEAENPFARDFSPRGDRDIRDPHNVNYAILAVAFELWYGRRQH